MKWGDRPTNLGVGRIFWHTESEQQHMRDRCFSGWTVGCMFADHAFVSRYIATLLGNRPVELFKTIIDGIDMHFVA